MLISKLVGSPTESDDICRGRCGPNEICRVVNNVPVCGSSGVNNAGKDKNPSSSYCQKHMECPSTQVCSDHTCVDPCSSSVEGADRLVCGGNARCVVVQHSPLCGCVEGMT